MLDVFCKLLGIRQDQAEDALKSERVARHALSRRTLFGASAMLATGAVFSFAAPVAEHSPFQDVWREPRGSTLANFNALLKERYGGPDFQVTALKESALLKLLQREGYA
jgi:hypothetical protein